MHLPNLAGNFSKRALSNTTPLNYRNSEILHFCNRNDNDHRKSLTTPNIMKASRDMIEVLRDMITVLRGMIIILRHPVT